MEQANREKQTRPAHGSQPTSRHTKSEQHTKFETAGGALLDQIGQWIQESGVKPILGRDNAARPEDKPFEETCPAGLMRRLEEARQRKPEGPPTPEELRRRAEAREHGVRRDGRTAGIPERMLTANFSTAETGLPLILRKPDADCQWNWRAYQLCFQIADQWQRDWNVRFNGLVLASPGKGPGKTYFMYALVMALIREKRAKCRVVKTVELLDKYRESYRNGGGCAQSSFQIFTEFATADVLLLDDLGAESIRSDENGGWAREQFFKLMDYRYERRLTTLATTNLTKDQLRAHYGERTVSRLLGLCAYVVMDGPDYRQTEFDANDENVDPFSVQE
ncbi:MAG: ATP-binding protein [Capsulimonas sp.]|uniref:ATP-binding protein n=1 Tax=Capsulimonas sp. TaxID=2494211 RepID=UPI0032670BDC